MTGNELRNVLKGQGVVLNELADKLGMSNQALAARLNVKKLKLDFIQQVENAVGFSVMESTTPSTPSAVDALIGLLQKRDEQMDRLISLLEKQINNEKGEKKRVG